MIQYVNIDKLSKLIGLSKPTIKSGIRSGRFPHIREDRTPQGEFIFDLRSVVQVLADEAYSYILKQKNENYYE